MNYNKIILGGHLTRDPELSYLPDKTPLVKGGIAVNHKYGKKEEVCFVDWVMFGKQATALAQYCKKGSPLLLEGRLTLDQWTDKAGNKRSTHKVVADRFTFVGEGNGGGQRTEERPPADDSEDLPF